MDNDIESNKEIVELLFETNAFQHLDKPVILTSGEIGIYYVNTEKLCQDDNEFKKYGNDPIAMMNHTKKLYSEKKIFSKVIDILSEKVSNNLNENMDFIVENELHEAVSGGQRRDWLFSFPVAEQIGVPHIALFKNGRVSYIHDGEIVSTNGSLRGNYAVHVADLLTEGSSATKTWVPVLRSAGAHVHDIYHIVTRLQGGEENLAKLEPSVMSYSLAAINADFVKMGKGTDEQKQQAIEYIKNPKAWSEAYISQNGISAFVSSFDPSGDKVERAEKFLDRYKDVLNATGNMRKLSSEVLGRYGIHIKK